MASSILARTIRGIRDTIPSGYVLGRASNSAGPAELISLKSLGQKVVGTGAVAAGGSGVLSLTAGTNISLSGSTGNVTINNTLIGGAGLWSGLITIPTMAGSGLNTWDNQASAVETDSPVGMSFTAPTNSSAHKLNTLYKSAPSTPYTATFLVLQGLYLTSGVYCYFLGWRSSTGKYDGILACFRDAIYTTHWSAATTLAADTDIETMLDPSPPLWWQLSDDGTTAIISLSMDGVNFAPFYTITKSTGYLGATGYNQIAFGIDCYSIKGGVTLASYSD